MDGKEDPRPPCRAAQLSAQTPPPTIFRRLIPRSVLLRMGMVIRQDSLGSAAAEAPPPWPAGNASSPILPPLTLPSVSVSTCVQKQDEVASANTRSDPEKPPAPRTEYQLFAGRLLRQRTRASRVVAVAAPAASSTKAPPSVPRNEAGPVGDQNPSLSAAATSSDIKNAPDQEGGGEQGTPDFSGSARAGEAAAGGGDGCRVGSVESYSWIGHLGEGGFGTVREARDTRTGDLVAIKSANEEGHGAALLREAALLAACLANSAVVGFREVVRGPAADELHIVMDFPSGSLRNLLDKRGRFDESETRDVMRQLLAGVEAMGAQGIVHGDLKPENVHVRKTDGRLLICDLGLAASVSQTPCNMEGTICYEAPEQLLGENKCGPAVDAWALGCVMAELLTGDLLAQAHNEIFQLMDLINLLAVPDETSGMDFSVDASKPSELRSKVPEEILTLAGFEVLRGLMEYDPEKRLTPAAALKMPWFAEAQEGAWALPTPRL